jgi:hypothetical protein
VSVAARRFVGKRTARLTAVTKAANEGAKLTGAVTVDTGSIEH